jgi:kinesin family member 2/24
VFKSTELKICLALQKNITRNEIGYSITSSEYLLSFHTSFYEIYGGRVFDLLNNRKQVQLMEDRNQKIQIQGLTSHEVNSAAELIECMEYGHSVRTTHSTTSNDTSSRSHAICQIIIKQNSGSSSRTIGKLTLVDLAVMKLKF